MSVCTQAFSQAPVALPPETAPVAPAAEQPSSCDYRDCPSLVVQLIEEDQAALALLRNHWRHYWDLVARYAGMSQFAAWGVPALRALQRDDRSDNAEQMLRDITRSKEAPAADLVEPARGFLKTLANTGFFNELDLLTAPGRFIPDRSSEPLLHSQQPQLGHSRELGRLLAIKMRLAAMDRDQEDFARAGRQGMAITRAAAYTGGISAHLAAVAVEADILLEVRRALREGRLEPAACRALIASMLELEVPMPSLALRCERLHALEVITGIYDKSGPGEHKANDSESEEAVEPTATASADASLTLHATREEAIELIDRFFEAWLDSISPKPETRASATKIIADYRARTAIPGDPVAESPVSFARFNVQAVNGVIAYAAGMRAGTLAMLAIELYRAERGELPATLDQLEPEFLPAVPMDPCLEGAPIGYKRDPAPGAKPGFVLYSVGFDAADNGGLVCPSGNRDALNAERGKGFDFILNSPD